MHLYRDTDGEIWIVRPEPTDFIDDLRCASGAAPSTRFTATALGKRFGKTMRQADLNQMEELQVLKATDVAALDLGELVISLDD